MVSYNELKKGVRIILENQPYEFIEASLLFKGRGHSVLQAKLKNLITGNVISKTFHPSDSFEETEVSKLKAKFIYCHKGCYFFSEVGDASKRFDLTEDQIGNINQFLKPKQEVEALVFQGKIINISLPIKIQLKVIDSPPGIKGDRAQAGTKLVTLETGAKVLVPLFVEIGDTIEINTENSQYVKRIQ